MKRRLLIVTFVLVLLGPFLGRALLRLGEAEPGLVERTVRLELRIITPHNQDIRETFDQAFSAWHERRFGEPVRVVYLTPRGTSDMVRYLRDVFANPDGSAREGARAAVDVAWGGGDVTFQRELLSLLQPLQLAPGVLASAFPEPDLNGVALYEPVQGSQAPRWVGVVLASFGIAFNPELYRSLGLPYPETWQDLARPELADLVALADPTRSASAAVAYMMVLQRAMADREAPFRARERATGSVSEQDAAQRQAAIATGYHEGLALLLRIAANARYFTDSGSRPCDDVGNAEAAAAMAIDFYARITEQELGADRVRYVAPHAATAITPDPVGVLRGLSGEQSTLANRFVEFLLTADAQRLWNLRPEFSPYLRRSLRRLPVVRAVYADRTEWADDVDPFESAGGFNLRQQWMGLFRDTRELWAAAWIDTASSLKAAYRAVLAVPDAAQRQSLLTALADLPVDLDEVLSHQARRAELVAQDLDSQLEDSRRRVRWARRFRAHYQEIASAAQAHATPRNEL